MEKRIGSLAELLPHPGETLLELLETYGISQIELAKRSIYLNPFGNNISYLNVHNYIRENYVPNKDNISFNSKVP